MTNEPEPVLLELAHLPREQVGPFLLLGLDKDAGKEDIEAHWAERVKWARKQKVNITLEEINWAREVITDPVRRLQADAASLNADTTDGVIDQLSRRYGLDEVRHGPSWEPLDEEKQLAGYRLDVPVPEAEEVRAGIAVPEAPREFPAAVYFLDQLARSPVDPWAVRL